MNKVTPPLREIVKNHKSTIRCSASLLMPLLLAGCSVFGIRNIEQAGYSVVEERGDYEIRLYESIIVAETTVEGDFDEAGDKAFKRLFNYISGENQESRQIAMTAPVTASDESGIDEASANDGVSISMTAPVIAENTTHGRWTFAFVLPASYSLESAPLPLNPLIQIVERPGKKVAVLRFTGFWDNQVIRKKTEKLESWLRSQNLEVNSLPRAAGYDPPWTIPFLRRNEVMIDIKG